MIQQMIKRSHSEVQVHRCQNFMAQCYSDQPHYT